MEIIVLFLPILAFTTTTKTGYSPNGVPLV
jgi:hypothetical protein